jgi:hypothetical protein
MFAMPLLTKLVAETRRLNFLHRFWTTDLTNDPAVWNYSYFSNALHLYLIYP